MLDVRGVVEESVALAPLVEELGYSRYWIAEHQPQPTPILVASILAGLTKGIRVGTAGILLHYYSPRRTAHDFHFLERAYEGRIDAGFCAGQDSDFTAEDGDGRDMPAILAAYPERVRRLVQHLRNTPGNPAYELEKAWPGALDDPPQIWSLGSGRRSADLAATNGLGFGYSLLYKTSVDDPATVQHYRETFVPDRTQPEPAAIVAVCVVCAPSTSAANDLAAEVPRDWFSPRVVGDPATCAAQLRALAERYDVDEIVIADRIRALDDRKRCYELVAEAMQ